MNRAVFSVHPHLWLVTGRSLSQFGHGTHAEPAPEPGHREHHHRTAATVSQVGAGRGRSREENMSSVQNPWWLMIMIIWDYTTQYIGDSNNPIGESLQTQPVWWNKKGILNTAHMEDMGISPISGAATSIAKRVGMFSSSGCPWSISLSLSMDIYGNFWTWMIFLAKMLDVTMM